ncbi:MAG: hypothetical protein ACYCQK_01610 [Acidiferrobacteraceae bacterium]
MILAWHGEPGLKAAALERLREHRRMDQIVQGLYYDRGRGCQLGCLTHQNEDTHAAAERLFGIEQSIGYWLEMVFERLPHEDCAQWVLDSAQAIPVGADMRLCRYALCAWLLGESELLPPSERAKDHVRNVRILNERAARGDIAPEAEWAAARAAAAAAWAPEARSAAARAWAARAAWASAWAAAWAAACAAEAAADAAARARAARAPAADAEADAVAEAARAAAAWRKIAARSLEIFAAAPVVTGPAIEPEIKRELCCRNLWCPDGAVVV